MNQRIRELAEQSGFFPVPDETESDLEYRAENARYERFAELIIQECIEVCEMQQYYDADDSYKKGVNSGSRTCVNALKRNFGIE